MGHLILLTGTILTWIIVIAGVYQRIFQMPEWFANPPASFELIRNQSKKARIFWIPLSTFLMISVLAALILNWQLPTVRSHLIIAISCYAISGALSGIYFVKEVIAFTKIPVNVPSSPELLARTKFWLSWTTFRNVLQFLASVAITIAYLHFD